jgi:CBS-domain-containing membrane protein
MYLANLCRREIISISTQASVHQAAEQMRVHQKKTLCALSAACI